MGVSLRLTILVCFGLALAAFWYAPVVFAFDELSIATLAGVAQLGGPGVAAICCFVAAWRGEGSDRAAWLNFGIGSALYLAGNLGYFYFSIIGFYPDFPAAPEAAFLVMALFFAVGMFQYAKVRSRVSRVQIYNFLLIYCAVSLASLFGLSSSLASSVMSPFGTIVAFLYPALWFSVAASGLISLLLYDHGAKSFPFALLLLAVFAESAADYVYVLSLMGGTYQPGGITQLLWVASGGLIAWAALDQMALTWRGKTIRPAEPNLRRGDSGVAQAAVPAAAIGMILLSGSASGALGSGPFVGVSAVLALIFAIVAGFREHWIISTERQLQGAVEVTRADVAKLERQLSSVLESTSDSILVVDRDWKVIFFNRQAVDSAKRIGQLDLGMSFWDAFPPAQSGGAAPFIKAMEAGEAAEFEAFLEDAKVWIGVRAFPIEEGLSIFFRDISEPRRIREEMVHMAHHDPMTGLANRLLFQEKLVEAIASGAKVATLLLDLDHFKEVNDTLGHPVGDAVLVETANRLKRCTPDHATIARLGGDEFAVIVAGYSGRTELLRLAQGLLDAAAGAHHVDGLTVRVGASVGIALSDGKISADQVFKNADIALYVAKSDARGSYCFFEPAMEAGLQQRQALRADLAAALERQQFELAYQPLIDLRTNRICGFEALLRWRHPVHGMVPPDAFIPIAEDTGLMIGIGDWVLRQACLEAANWPDDISVAVNLSTRQFSDDDLVAKIAATLEFTGLAHQRLELEITESVLLKDDNANLLTLRRLREHGIRIALDDFGTGYSSLGYLQRFPFSKIKIDRSFINGLPGNGESQAIVRSVIGLGQSLGMRVTAEGVETAEQLAWVKDGCDEAQGYLLSRPIPASELAGLIGKLNAPSERLAG